MRRTVFSGLSAVFFQHPIVSTVCFELVLLVAFGLIGYYNPDNLRTPLALAVRYLFFPLLGLGLVLWIVAAFTPAERRRKLRTLGCLCFISPLVAVHAYYADSVYLIQYYEALSPAAYLALAFVLAWGPCATAMCGATGSRRVEASLAGAQVGIPSSDGSVLVRSRRKIAGAMALSSLIMMFFVWVSARPFLSDFLQPRQKIEGTVTGLAAHERPILWNSRPLPQPCWTIDQEYYVYVVASQGPGEHGYPVKRDMFLQLHKGDSIRAEAASCSDIILNVER